MEVIRELIGSTEIDKAKVSIAESKATRAIEDELDIGRYEAAIVLRLRKQGKIK